MTTAEERDAYLAHVRSDDPENDPEVEAAFARAREAANRHEWARDPDERYGVYVAIPMGDGRRREGRLLATTSKDGIGTALVQLREDGEIDETTRVGILDGIEGRWIVNPFANGAPIR